MGRRHGPARRWPIALGVSLVLHAAIGLPLFAWITDNKPHQRTTPPRPPASQAMHPCAAIQSAQVIKTRAQFGPDALRHRIDLWRPPADHPQGPWPAVLIFADDAPVEAPDLLRRTPPLAPRLAELGYVVAVVRATTPKGDPLSVQEGKLAVRWLKAQRDYFNLRPNKLGIVGGHLAALVGLSAGASTLGDWAPSWLDTGTLPAALAIASVPGPSASRALDTLLSGCATPEPCPRCGPQARAGLLSCAGDARCDLQAADPIEYISPEDPPTLIIAGESDCVAPEAPMRRLFEGLQSVGVAAQWRSTPGPTRPEDLTSAPTRQMDVELFFQAELRGCYPVARTVPLLTEAQLQRLHRKVKKEEPKEKEEPKPTEKPDRQVVQIAPPKNQRRPKDARLLSEYDSAVEREQVSRHKRPPTPRVVKSELRKLGRGDKRAGKSHQTPTLPGQKRPQREAVAKRPGDAATQGKQTGPKPTPKTAAKAKSKPAELNPGEGPFVRQPKAAPPKPNSGGTSGGAPAPDDWHDLLPSLGPEAIARSEGSIDHIEDMAEGEGTFLNTAQYKHAWFFNRVKEAISHHWRAVDAHRRNDPYGRIYGVRDRRTVLQVTLNADGSLDDVFVHRDSGVAFLDDAALRAFRQAQPFPNPPEALKDPDGRIRFKFAFFLEIGGRGMRFFRSP